MIVDIPPLKFEVSGITRLLRKINTQKGPWCWQYLSCWVLKKLRLSLPHFSSIFLLYQYQTGQVPSDWVAANDTPVFKKRNRASQVITDRFLWKSNFSKKFLQLENSPPTPHPPPPTHNFSNGPSLNLLHRRLCLIVVKFRNESRTTNSIFCRPSMLARLKWTDGSLEIWF